MYPVDTHTPEGILRQNQHVYLAEETNGERLDDTDFDLHFEEAFEAYWQAGARDRVMKAHTDAGFAGRVLLSRSVDVKYLYL